jgi:hypothetical protein
MADLIPEFPFVLENGDTPDADQFMANWQHIRDWLNDRFGNATDKQLWVADSSGRATPRTISGDVTLSNDTGTVAIGNNKISNAMMQDDSVDTPEIRDDAVGPAQLNLTGVESSLGSPANISTVFTSVLSAGNPTAGDYLIIATLCGFTTINDNGVAIKFNFDSDTRASAVWTTLPIPFVDPIPPLTIAAFHTFDGSSQLTLQAKKLASSANPDDVQADDGNFGSTKILRIKLAV